MVTSFARKKVNDYIGGMRDNISSIHYWMKTALINRHQTHTPKYVYKDILIFIFGQTKQNRCSTYTSHPFHTIKKIKMDNIRIINPPITQIKVQNPFYANYLKVFKNTGTDHNYDRK